MKCATHNSDAVGICVNCGRAMCGDCAVALTPQSAPARLNRLACSSQCAEAIEQKDKELRLLLLKSMQSARASAYYCYLCSLLSAAGAVVAWFMLPSTFLILFTAGCSIALFLSGLWYGRVASKHTV